MFPFVYSILEQDQAERDHGAGWGPWENLPRELLSARNGSLLTNSLVFQYSVLYLAHIISFENLPRELLLSRNGSPMH